MTQYDVGYGQYLIRTQVSAEAREVAEKLTRTLPVPCWGQEEAFSSFVNDLRAQARAADEQSLRCKWRGVEILRRCGLGDEQIDELIDEAGTLRRVEAAVVRWTAEREQLFPAQRAGEDLRGRLLSIVEEAEKSGRWLDPPPPSRPRNVGTSRSTTPAGTSDVTFRDYGCRVGGQVWMVTLVGGWTGATVHRNEVARVERWSEEYIEAAELGKWVEGGVIDL